MNIKKLQWWMGGGGLSLYPSTDYAIVSGAPNEGTALDYLAFVDSAIATDGTRYLIYYEGQDHSGTSEEDTSIIFRKRPPAGALGSPVTIATGTVGVAVSNPALGVTQTGRVLAFYERIDTTVSPSYRTEYFKYSDDDGDTWSAEILFSAEQEVGQPFYQKQLAGVGGAIQYDGYMLKPMYGTTAPGTGGRLGRLYKSVDDGITWTFVSNIWPSSDDDGEEPCIIALTSGRLIVSQRSDSVDETRLIYSDDAGLTWSDPVSIGFLSQSKSALAVSPAGMIMIIGRWAASNGRPIFSYTNSSTGISGWSAFQEISVRATSFMYGGIIWDHLEEMFIANWAQGVPNETTPGVSGPTIIFEKEFIPSTTAIAPPPTYTQEYQLFIDYPQGLGVTVTEDLALRSLHNQLVQFLIDDGIWDTKLEIFYNFEHNDATLADWSLYNWKTPWRYLATATNAPTYGVLGWSFNGTDEIIDLNWDGFNKLIYTQNDASHFTFVAADGGGSSGRASGASNANLATQTRGPHINPRNATDQFVWQINDDTNSTVSSITDGTGLKFVSRPDANTKLAFNNGAQIGTASVASVVPTAVDIGVGGMIFANGNGLFRACTVSMVGTGSAMTGLEAQFYTRLNWYRTQVALL